MKFIELGNVNNPEQPQEINSENKSEEIKKLQQDFYEKLMLCFEAKKRLGEIEAESLQNFELLLNDKDNKTLRAKHEEIEAKREVAINEERKLDIEQRVAAKSLVKASENRETADSDIEKVYIRLAQERPDLV